MIFPKPEWIRYKVTYRTLKRLRHPFIIKEIYIYAHGEQMVRDILDEYEVTRIEREDKDD